VHVGELRLLAVARESQDQGVAGAYLRRGRVVIDVEDREIGAPRDRLERAVAVAVRVAALGEDVARGR
jgi:hypothetical protein